MGSATRVAEKQTLRLNQELKSPLKSKAVSRLARPYPDLEPLNDLLRIPPKTTEERLLHIAALGQRIQQYIKFMGVIVNMAGSSIEAKELAIVVFHDCLVALEPQLGNIPEEMSCSYPGKSPWEGSIERTGRTKKRLKS